MNKKVVFLDMDGTLILPDGTMPESAREALRRARANGHEMVICTGRSTTQIEPVLKENADLFDGCVAAAGAQVSRGGETIWHDCMSPEMAKKLVDFFRAHNVTYFLQADSGVYAEPASLQAIVNAFKALGRTEIDVEEIFGYTVLDEHPENVPYIEKCCYFECPHPADVVQRELGPDFYVIDSSYKVTRFCDGEINKAGVNKATGMEKYLEAAGVPHEDCIAFGDGPNDLEMIQYAALGVCMGNGTDRLKALADRICGRIDEDGIYNEFQALGLI